MLLVVVKKIIVNKALYDEDKTTTPETEYRLDDGEWIKGTDSVVTFSELAPASLHILYARTCAKEGYAASEAISVEIKLKKGKNDCVPNTNEIEYEITGKTVCFTLNDGIELSLDSGITYSSEKEISNTYTDAGFVSVYIRYAETATHTESNSRRVDIKITEFEGGIGTEKSPYRIGTLEQFKNLKQFYEDGAYFAITDDIAFDDEIWERNTLSNIKIDGRGHTLFGIRQKTPLFYYVAVIKNLTIANAEYHSEITEDNPNGISSPSIIAGRLNYAENVSVNGSITVSAAQNVNSIGRYPIDIGGICSQLLSKSDGNHYGMKNCRVDLTLSLPNLTDVEGEGMILNMGGLAAWVLPDNSNVSDSTVTITQCNVNINVTHAYVSSANVGGIIGGYSSDNIGITTFVNNCYTTGNIRLSYREINDNADGGFGTSRIGGIAPGISGNIEYCYSSIDFDIDTKLYARKGETTILLGGICVSANNASDFAEQNLRNCLFAGSVNVTNSAQENIGGTFKLDVICADARSFDNTEYLFYLDSAILTDSNAVKADALDGAITVTENDVKSARWQYDSIKFDDAYWVIENGKLPVLKQF